MRIHRKEDMLKRTFFKDSETERLYWRVMGGICFPGERPGFAVVIGEELQDRPEPPFHLYLLEEIEEQNPSDLIRGCLQLEHSCQVGDWYGYLGNQADVEFLALHNRTAINRRESVLNVQAAPQTERDSIQFHLSVLLSRLNPAAKTLHLGAESRLQGYLAELQAADQASARASQYPAIGALGYVVAQLTMYEYNPVPMDRQDRAYYEPGEYL